MSVDTAERLHQQLVTLAWSDGRIYAVGDPDTTLNGVVRARWWFPVNLDVRRQSGEIVAVKDGIWDFWFNNNAGFRWAFGVSDAPGGRWTSGRGETRAAVGVIAETRYGMPLAVQVRLVTNWEASGDVFWLPAPSQLTPHDAITLLLRSLGIAQISEAPAWTSGFGLPNEITARQDLISARAAVERARQDEVIARGALTTEARFSQLLYATGAQLEAIVIEALSVLGGAVESPTADKEDGGVVDPRGRNALLEIKGLKGAVGVENVRQLQGWALDAISEGWEGKTVLIANTHRAMAPGERPEAIADSAKKFAERTGAAILTTPQIYEALRQQQIGDYDSGRFWDAVFETDGLVDLPEIAAAD
jgi:hypothetical protein